MKINIVQLDRKPEHGEVVTVHWTASLEQDGVAASTYGADSFEPDTESENFVPFEELIEEDVVGWLEAKQDWLEHVQNQLDSEIESQRNPPMLHGLPWTS